MLNYNSPSSIKAFLDEKGIAPQKRFGQNFLINPQARTALADALQIGEDCEVWEIGAGLGAMTAELLKRGARLTCFEIDKAYAGILRALFSKDLAENRLVIIEGDCLKTWEKAPRPALGQLYMLGNLPYNIGAPLLGAFLEGGLLFSRFVVTLQKEAALRFTAKPGEKDYSSLAAAFSLFYNAQKIMTMSGGFFYPPPKVESTALLFEKKKITESPPPLFFMLTRALFALRRKTVLNNLRNFLAKKGLEEAALNTLCLKLLSDCGIKENARASELSAENFLSLAAVCKDIALLKNIREYI